MSRHEAKRRWDAANPRHEYKRKWEREQHDVCQDCGTLISGRTKTRRCPTHAAIFRNTAARLDGHRDASHLRKAAHVNAF